MEDDISKQIVVKSNALIESQYKMSILPQKILRKVISMVSPTDDHFEKRRYRVTVQDMDELLKDDVERPLAGSFYSYIRKAVTTLQRTIIQIPVHKHKKTTSWQQTTWFAFAEYNAEDGYYEFEFSIRLEQELLKLHEIGYYTQYHLSNVAGLSSQYSIRIYELLAQIRNQVIKERIFQLTELKSILGIPSNQYKKYSHFKIKILEISKTELTAKTNIPFEYKPIKTGRKVTAIKFIIVEKTESPEQPATPAEKAILDKVPPSARKAARDAIKKRGIEGSQESLAYAESQIKKGHVNDSAAYVAKCLSNGFGAKTQTERIAEQEREAKIAELRREANQLEKAADAELQKAKETAARQNALLESLTPEQDAELSRLAEKRIGEAAGDFEKNRYLVQKKAGETMLIDRYKRGLVEEFLTGA